MLAAALHATRSTLTATVKARAQAQTQALAQVEALVGNVAGPDYAWSSTVVDSE